MSDINIAIKNGQSKRLLTKWKICDKNIVVSVENSAYDDAVRNYAPIIIHYKNGHGALPPMLFTRMPVGTITFNYTDFLDITMNGGSPKHNTMEVVVTNNHPFLSCEVQITGEGTAPASAMGSASTVSGTRTEKIAPGASASFYWMLESISTSGYFWNWDIDSLKWEFAN